MFAQTKLMNTFFPLFTHWLSDFPTIFFIIFTRARASFVAYPEISRFLTEKNWLWNFFLSNPIQIILPASVPVLAQKLWSPFCQIILMLMLLFPFWFLSRGGSTQWTIKRQLLALEGRMQLWFALAWTCYQANKLIKPHNTHIYIPQDSVASAKLIIKFLFSLNQKGKICGERPRKMTWAQ